MPFKNSDLIILLVLYMYYNSYGPYTVYMVKYGYRVSIAIVCIGKCITMKGGRTVPIYGCVSIASHSGNTCIYM